MLFLFSIHLQGQDNLTFEVNIIQAEDTFAVSENKIKLKQKEFTFEITMPADMLEFQGEKFSSINYVATASKSFFKEMKTTKCFKCENAFTPFAYNKHNSEKSIVVSNRDFSFWSVSGNGDDHNVSAFKLVGAEIIASVLIQKLFMHKDKKDILLEEFKGTIYLVFEAANRDSSKIGKRTFATITIK